MDTNSDALSDKQLSDLIDDAVLQKQLSLTIDNLGAGFNDKEAADWYAKKAALVAKVIEDVSHEAE